MSFTLQVHRPINKDGIQIGMRSNPYTRLANGEEHVIIQDGAFYGQGGKPIDEVPEWVLDAIDNMSQAAQDSLKVKARPKSAKVGQFDKSVAKA